MIQRPPRSTQSRSSAASDVYKRQILNSLLTILNERKYHNGREIVDVPLLSVFGASNEFPEEEESLEALFDRFLFRYRLSYIQDDENFQNLLFRSPNAVSYTHLTLPTIY